MEAKVKGNLANLITYYSFLPPTCPDMEFFIILKQIGILVRKLTHKYCVNYHHFWSIKQYTLKIVFTIKVNIISNH